MRKECIDIVPQLRKKYRIYIGLGIPDPWIDKSENPSPRGLSVGNIEKYLCHLPHCKHLKKNFRKGLCICCKKKYLLECPDDCDSDINFSSHRNYHDKNAKTTDFSKNCKGVKFLKNSVLKQKQSQEKSSKSTASSSSNSGLEAGDKNQNLKENKRDKSNECNRTQKAYDSSVSEKSAKERLFKYASSKKQSNVCFCPYIKSCSLRRTSQKNHVKNFLEPRSSSKLIQAEIQPIKISKTSQTESAESKKQIKCKCSNNKCVRCRTYECKTPWLKSSCPAAHTVSCLCFPLECSQKPAFICSCFFSNNFLHHNFNKHKNKAKKERSKTKQHKETETDDESNDNPKFEQNSLKLDEKYNFKEQILHETNDHNLKSNKNILYASKYPKPFNHLKYLTDEKLKYYLQQEEIPSSILNNQVNHSPSRTGSRLISFYKGDTPLYNLTPEKLKTCTNYKPRDFKSSFMNSKMSFQENHLNCNARRFNYSDQATMTRVLSNDCIAEDKFFKEKVESDESRTNDLSSNRVFSTKAMRKRRRILANRKRRKKLAASGKISFLEYQTLLNNLPKGPALINKQAQVKQTFSDFNLKRALFLTSDTLDSNENNNLKFKNNTSSFEHITSDMWKKIGKEISSRNLNKLEGNEDTLKRRLRSELNIDGVLEKISYNSGSSWSSSALKNIVNDLLMDKKYQEQK